MNFDDLEEKKPVKKQASSVKKKKVITKGTKTAIEVVDFSDVKVGVFYKSVYQTCDKCDRSVVHRNIEGVLTCSDCGFQYKPKPMVKKDEEYLEGIIVNQPKYDSWLLLF